MCVCHLPATPADSPSREANTPWHGLANAGQSKSELFVCRASLVRITPRPIAKTVWRGLIVHYKNLKLLKTGKMLHVYEVIVVIIISLKLIARDNWINNDLK